MMKFVGRVLPYLAGLALVVVLVRQVNLREILALLQNASPRWVAIGCGWYLLTNILRALRFRALLGPVSVPSAIPILPEMFALSFLNNVLPSRTGELSFPYFMQQRHHIQPAESATALLLARIFDYLAVITLFILFALYELGNLESNAARIVMYVIGASVISCGLLLLAPWISSILLGMLRESLALLRLDQGKFGHGILNFSQEVVKAMHQMRSGSVYLRTYSWSLGIWVCTFGWFWAFLIAIRIPVRFTLVVVGATFASLAKALPFITVGGFGAHEAGWGVGFSLTGMDPTLAITSGFTVNILTLAMSVLFGGTALLWMGMVRLKYG